MEPKNKYGTTSSSIAFATELAIQHNIKVLLISTALNDPLIRDSFWPQKKKSHFSLFSGSIKMKEVETSGIVGLDRMIRSNKLTPDIITDYAKIVLTNRLEILLGVEGDENQYNVVKEKYSQIISLANKYYDTVIVDLDNKIGKQTEIDILNTSDIVVALVPQRAKEIERIQKMINEKYILNEQKTIMAIGKYMENTKYNAKNITRNLLKEKEIINTIPYNNLFFEATQEGTVIDLFLNFMRIREKDENYNFVQELKNLNETIKGKLEMIQIMNNSEAEEGEENGTELAE